MTFCMMSIMKMICARQAAMDRTPFEICRTLLTRRSSEVSAPPHAALYFSSVADPDLHLKSPPGSAWRDADPDPGGKKA